MLFKNGENYIEFELFLCYVFVNIAQKHFVFKSLNANFHYLWRDSYKYNLFELLLQMMSFNGDC